MPQSLRASPEGLALVDRARQQRGWTRTTTALWWNTAHTSKATLRRFWQRQRIQRENFIALCEAVGIHDWQTVAEGLTKPELGPPGQEFNPVIGVTPAVSPPVLDWSDAPDIASFFGRQEELSQLEQWMVRDRCKLVVIVGMGGIGKTALALTVCERVQSQFDGLIWRSLPFKSTFEQLLDSLLEEPSGTRQPVEQRIVQLIARLRRQRCLLVLDSWEAIFQQKDDLQQYSSLLQRLSSDRYPSCVLITSQVIPQAIETELLLRSIPYVCLPLRGLQDTDATALLRARGMTGSDAQLSILNRLYSGNPLALQIVAARVRSVFGGNTRSFLKQKSFVLGQLREVLQQQIARLSDWERELTYWLVIWQEPVSLEQLQRCWLGSPDPGLILEGLFALERQSLLEKRFSADDPCFTLHPLVMRVATDELIEQSTQELLRLLEGHPLKEMRILRDHCLVRPSTLTDQEPATDPLQDRLLLPIQNALWRRYGSELLPLLQEIFSKFTDRSSRTVGYSIGNLAVLIHRLKTVD